MIISRPNAGNVTVATPAIFSNTKRLYGVHAAHCVRATSVQAVQALDRRLYALQQLSRHETQGRPLRVITGRGLHSSDGEASLPRVVGTRLEELKQDLHLRVVQRAGAAEVYIGRQTTARRGASQTPL